MTVSRLLVPRRRWSAAVAVLLIVGVGSCGTPRAAEPAKAPPVTATPAGTVVRVGDQAEGIVADPDTHIVAVGVRNPNGLVLLDGRTGAGWRCPVTCVTWIWRDRAARSSSPTRTPAPSSRWGCPAAPCSPPFRSSNTHTR